MSLRTKEKTENPDECNIASTELLKTLTDSEWRELKLTGYVIRKDGTIIRNLK